LTKIASRKQDSQGKGQRCTQTEVVECVDGNSWV